MLPQATTSYYFNSKAFTFSIKKINIKHKRMNTKCFFSYTTILVFTSSHSTLFFTFIIIIILRINKKKVSVLMQKYQTLSIHQQTEQSNEIKKNKYSNRIFKNNLFRITKHNQLFVKSKDNKYNKLLQFQFLLHPRTFSNNFYRILRT